MREIKFRAWDLEDEEYISWHQLTHTRYNQDYLREHGDPDGPFLGFMTDKHIRLEQFTGLHDKNGKEIFEGDVVRTSLFYNGCRLPHLGKIVYSDEHASFATENEGGITLVYNHATNDREVIGNIHENPELMNG